MAHYNLNKREEDLINRNIIDLRGEVNEAMAFYVRECLVRLIAKDSPDIHVFISSKGGDVPFGLDIYDMLSVYAGKKIGTVFIYAYSMASTILQACDERRCAKNASILIHHISRKFISLDDLRDKKRLKNIRHEMEKHQKRIYEILCQKTGKPKVEVVKTCAEDRTMTAEEAMVFGLVDKIIKKLDF